MTEFISFSPFLQKNGQSNWLLRRPGAGLTRIRNDDESPENAVSRGETSLSSAPGGECSDAKKERMARGKTVILVAGIRLELWGVCK